MNILHKIRIFTSCTAAFVTIASADAAFCAPPPPFGGLLTDYGYVELADMALTAPVVISADIASAVPLKEMIGIPGGKTRYYVEADVRGLIAGKTVVPARISYLVDLPTDPKGKKAKLKGVPVLLLAVPTETPGMVRLVSPNAQVPRTPENEARVRSILTASVAADAPPAITGIQRAFHVKGSLPGESETQISLNILRRPGEEPRWAVALTEMVDNSAAPPTRDSLLWYRLACGLPRTLPAPAVSALEPADADAAIADYAVVRGGLGACRAG